MCCSSERPGVTNLPELRVTELVHAQPAEGPVQLQQLQGVPVQSTTDQETREAWRQEQQMADVSLIHRGEDRQKCCNVQVPQKQKNKNPLSRAVCTE